MKVDDDLARQVIKPRLRESHKGSYGRVLLVGGLYPYGGAIIMAAIACVNSGAGLVTVATDRDNITALHAHLPEAMAFDLRETERFLDNLRAADVVLIGSGLGEDGVARQAMDLVLVWFKDSGADSFKHSESPERVPSWDNPSCQESQDRCLSR